ncbi:MAG TPA: AraC family transcriptional regulator [Candidatus Blautia merdavium]|uniref:AraC family transcriptional regulator n=1 Tax=Candidatus Blautia merdavium TaxID=2838494 RepID=A0A9D2TA49_9FIRM|nr:AraC family transcriptional regulator [Candidatus Blautia merdavium]
MPIYFRNTPLTEPFTLDSIGDCWQQIPVSRPKGYPHYHYLQTEEGMGKIFIQGKEYPLHPGEGVLIAPFIRHAYSGDEQWRTAFFTLTGTIESSIARILDNRQVIFVDKDQGAKIRELIGKIVKKYENPPLDAKELSIDCYTLLMQFVNGVYSHSLAEDPLYKRYVEPVLKEMELHYAEQISIQELSEKVYVTPQYLSRLFRRFLGCSAYEYLTVYRINKAKEFLLCAPRVEVQEISARVGFLDASHFTAMFKKMAGVTPLEFRRMN